MTNSGLSPGRQFAIAAPRPLACAWSVVNFSTSQPRGLFLILLPDVPEPLGLGALSGVENRPDDGRTSVGMKRD